MNPSTAQTAHHVLTGATIGGGLIEWVTLNSSFITVVTVALTSIASIAIGVWNARTNSEKNRIDRRHVVERLITKLDVDEDETYTADDIKTMLRKH